jgi:hypothetical protein
MLHTNNNNNNNIRTVDLVTFYYSLLHYEIRKANNALVFLLSSSIRLPM